MNVNYRKIDCIELKRSNWRSAHRILYSYKLKFKLKRKFYKTSIKLMIFYTFEYCLSTKDNIRKMSMVKIKMLSWMNGMPRLYLA